MRRLVFPPLGYQPSFKSRSFPAFPPNNHHYKESKVMNRRALLLVIFVITAIFVCNGICAAGMCDSPGCVTKTDIRDKAVVSSKIRNKAVSTSKIQPGAVTRSKIADSVAALKGNGMVKAWARIKSDETVASCWRCNKATTETRRLGVGDYEVDFTPLSTDIRGRPRMAILDAFGAIYFFSGGGIRVSDRLDDPSSVFVNIYDPDGNDLDSSFNIIVF